MSAPQNILSLQPNEFRHFETLILKNQTNPIVKFAHIFLLGIIFTAFSFSMTAQEIRELRKGEFIILYSDGTLTSYDAENPVHKRLKQEYEAIHKPVKKRWFAANKPVSGSYDTLQRAARVKELYKTLHTERQNGIALDSAYKQRKMMRERLHHEQKLSKPNPKKIAAHKTALEKAKITEKTAKKAFDSSFRNSTAARKELRSYQISLSGNAPYVPLYKKNKACCKFGKSSGPKRHKLSLQLPSFKHINSRTRRLTSDFAANFTKFYQNLFHIKPKSTAPLKAKLVKADEETTKAPNKIVSLKPSEDVMQNPPVAGCKILLEGKDRFKIHACG